MKSKATATSSTLIVISIIATSLTWAAPRSTSDTTQMRDVAKHDELSLKLRMAQQSDPVKNLGPAIGNLEVDPAIPQFKRSFLDSSTILCYRGVITFVPKRAVLHVPEHLESRIGVTGDIEIKNWPDFYLANRGWIRTIEVTREQAMGDVPFSEATLEAISTSSSLIVATFKNGPIAVRPPPPEPDEDEDEDEDSEDLANNNTETENR
tara:strand:+ start:1458 stop:2081 length:624 start_codon:yes stop_codon:yes gene_type:complete